MDEEFEFDENELEDMTPLSFREHVIPPDGFGVACYEMKTPSGITLVSNFVFGSELVKAYSLEPGSQIKIQRVKDPRLLVISQAASPGSPRLRNSFKLIQPIRSQQLRFTRNRFIAEATNMALCLVKKEDTRLLVRIPPMIKLNTKWK